MKKLLKILAVVVAAASLTLSVGCKTEKGVITIAVPDGAPTLSLYSLMDGVNSVAGYEIKYKVLSGSENIGKTLVSGAADCAVMPVNVAAKLYNTGNDLKLLSVNVFGVLYLVGNEEIGSASDLTGKVVVTIGKGATPDISLKKILDGNGVEYVDGEAAVEGKVAVTYAADAPTAMRYLAAGKADYAILGEPQVTVACKNLGVKIVIDIKKEWTKLVGADTFAQAGFVMSQKVYSDSDLVEGLYKRLSENAAKIALEPEKVKATVQKYGSGLQVDFTKEIIARCNLGCKGAADIKTSLIGYFDSVMEYDPTFIGGKFPDDGFYY